jgi:hypothetical protein
MAEIQRGIAESSGASLDALLSAKTALMREMSATDLSQGR